MRLTLWAGTLNQELVGPIVIDGALTGQKYVELLNEWVAELGIGEEFMDALHIITDQRLPSSEILFQDVSLELASTH